MWEWCFMRSCISSASVCRTRVQNVQYIRCPPLRLLLSHHALAQTPALPTVWHRYVTMDTKSHTNLQYDIGILPCIQKNHKHWYVTMDRNITQTFNDICRYVTMDTKVPQAFNGVGMLLWLQKSHEPSEPHRYVTMDTNRPTDVTLGTNWYTTCGKGHVFSYLNNLLVYGVLQKCYHEIHVFFF